MASVSNSPMRKVSLRNLAAHKVRLALTVLSVVLGTAFVAGSFVFTDTLQKTFDSIFEGTAEGVDVRVSMEERGSGGVPVDDVDKLAAIDGVRAVAPAVTGQVVLINSGGGAVQTGGAPSLGMSYLPPGQAITEPDPIVEGSPPTQSGQIALNVSAAERAGLKVGDSARVLAPARGIVEVTLTGIYQGSGSDTGGFIGVVFTDEQARQLFTDGRHVDYIDVAGTGESPTALQQRIEQVFPDLKVQTGDQVREETKEQVDTALSFVNYFLLAFGAIALLVGTFIIYNTFSMIVAQRLRELALLRAIGASRAQVGRSVVTEALVVGIIGSVIGLLGGIGLAYGLRNLLNAFDVGLPEGPLQVGPRTIVIALVVGIVVTTISAYAPARRASKVPPVAAMREEFASTGDSLRVRTLVGAALGVVGAVLLVVGSQGTGNRAAATVGLGAFALILAVLLGAPALSRPIVGALGAVFAKPFGPIGRLARTNAVRNPRRTAATAFALTLGLMLVTVIGVFGSSAKTSINALVDVGFSADYILTGPNAIGVPPGAAGAVRKVPDVQSATSLHGVRATVNGESEQGVSFDGPIEGVVDYTIVDGTADLSGNNMLVSQTTAEDKGWTVGSTETLTGPNGVEYQAVVSGVFENNQLIGSWIVSDEAYRKLMPADSLPDFVVLVKAKPGTDLTTLRSELESATESYVVVQVQDRDEFKGAQGEQINTLLAILYGLLALAVVIAILGIVNTLALSVVERRREIGMLRAVGMQRAQMRRTIYLESVLIAVYGAAVGVVLGIAFGWAFVSTLADQGLDKITIPWGQVVGMLIGSGVVGVLAALWPANRAAKTKPLDAIADM
ncbi:putative ABC transport system permease protein [Rhodococcus sp. 27YEA15]|uniref:ABC transporter permease n=1 Tax=Rhodococcus sp. 27YEA15 TaxID=3156259 RepID=UPI003C7A259C